MTDEQIKEAIELLQLQMGQTQDRVKKLEDAQLPPDTDVKTTIPGLDT